ncbi:hypothetical protein LTS10_007302 [Elasticomyces elasticus]|nr:hypothetical protein LTS10_007302 [Elasticomyces elasticus]
MAKLFANRTAHVLISGAGIAGPCVAWWLAKAGAQVTVVEKAASLLVTGQNIDVNGSALKIIDRMGLMDELRRRNTTEKGTQLIDQHGRPFASFPVTEGVEASPTSEFEILRGDLALMLYDASKDHPNVEYRFGITVQEVLSNDEKSVKVKLSNGEVETFHLLVAADGQWSKIRKQCFKPETIRIVDKNMTAIYATIPRLPADNMMWNIYFALESRIVSTRPDPYGTIRACFTRMPCNDEQKLAWQSASRSDQKTQKELLRSTFANAGWQAQRLLDGMDAADDFYFHAIQQIRMSTWSESRVICLGDAAYAPTPLTGMGASLAILGSYVLAGEISKLDDGEHPERAMKAYESAFKPFVEEIQSIPFFFPAAVHPKTALRRWILQTILWTLAKLVAIPWIVKRFSGDEKAEDFPLPQYETFADAVSEKSH